MLSEELSEPVTGRTDRAVAIARDFFGIDGEAVALPGELDLNFRISAPEGPVVLKLSPESRRPLFEMTAACLGHIYGATLSGQIPGLVSPVATIAGSSGLAATRQARQTRRPPSPIVNVDFEGVPFVASAITYIKGVPMATVSPRRMELLEALGSFLAQLDMALSDFDHPELDRAFGWRMESAAEVIRDRPEGLPAPQAELTEATLERALQRFGPDRADLPTGVIHNDANDYNVIVIPTLNGPRLAGLIDFGDVVRSWRIVEPAVAAAYAMMGLADPVAAACAIAKGYASVTPLRGPECRAFIPLAALRLCLSLCIQSRQIRQQPENEYLAVSQRPAWRLLQALADIDWRIAEFRIREACGLPPNPRCHAVTSWLRRAQPRASLLAPARLARPRVIDLSVESPDSPQPAGWTGEDPAARTVQKRPDGARGDPAFSDGFCEDTGPWAGWIGALLLPGATVGVGRYGEARLLYDAPGFVGEGNDGPEARTVHLGVDLFAPAGTAVYAPLPGAVLSVANNTRPLDYGPTVILRHTTGDGTGFHTLYGHLNEASLHHLVPGQRVEAGEIVGWLGVASVNGGWPPHLHFQVMALDPLYDVDSGSPQGRDDARPWTTEGTGARDAGNFPAVVLPRLRAVWESVLPDPSPLVGFSEAAAQSLRPLSDPDAVTARIRLLRKSHLPPSLSLSYATPVHVVRGSGPYLFDREGCRYLDTVNNVAHVGHANPRVTRAIVRQSRVLNTNTRYLHEEIVALAEALLAHFPAPLDVVYLVCSGSEANELALRLARCHTGNDGVVVLEGGYHGNTGGLVEVSPYKFDGPGGAGASPRVAVAPMPDPYRGRHRRNEGGTGTEEELGTLYAREAIRATERLADPGVAAFVAEPILGCGGQIEPPAGYLKAVYRYIRGVGGVCVADEVQTGFGRTGDAFWAFELQGVVPDIVTLGKPMGNGHPVGAVVTNREIADSFANGMEYFNTFGGNPVSCAAARAVLSEIRDRDLRERARKVGGDLLGMLGQLAKDRPVVGDVRGRGMFLGIELVRDPAARAPFPEACTYVVERMRERGIFTSADGLDRNVLKFKPPLVFGEDDALRFVETLDAILAETALE